MKPDDQESTAVATLDPGPDKVIGPGHDYGTVTDEISGVVLRPFLKTPTQLFRGFACAFLLVNLLMVAVTWLFARGVGVWGIMIPVAWGFAIVNFVWWIGIGHAGTLISAILLLLKQDWRTSINRFSEAMTLFAVACAGMFPVLHLGRPWLAYWLLPYPNTMWLWPQPRSPLIWDVFAVSTYATVSVIFWFTGLIPDLATMRDKAENRTVQKIYGLAGHGMARLRHALGALSEGLSAARGAFDAPGGFGAFGGQLRFRGGHCARLAHHHFPSLLRCRCDLLRIRNGAVSRHPGPALVSPRRSHHHAPHRVHVQGDAGDGVDRRLRLRDGGVHGVVQRRHLRTVRLHQSHVGGRILVDILGLNPVQYSHSPTALVAPRAHESYRRCFMISLVVNVGMWLERFVIVVTSLTRDFVPSSWGMYYPTIWDWSTYLGTIGVFLSLMFLFIRGLAGHFDIRNARGSAPQRGGRACSRRLRLLPSPRRFTA